MYHPHGSSSLFALALAGLFTVQPAAAAPPGAAHPVARARSGSGAPTAASVASRGLIMVSDFDGRIRVMDPVSRAIVYDYSFTEQASESCSKKGVHCMGIGASWVNHNDEDFLDMALYVSNYRPGTSKIDRGYSAIQRVIATTPAPVVWKIKDLDFRQALDGASYCTQDQVNPASFTDPRCRPRLVHSIQVVNDDVQNKRVSVVLADFMNSRIVQATLDYTKGSTLATVDWVLGSTNPDWPAGANPNAARLITDQPGGPYLLTTFYSTSEQTHGSHLMMWQWKNGAWMLNWQFPDETDETGPEMLNTPHMGEVLIDPVTGGPLISYSHSRGMAGSWTTTTEYAGTYGLLRPGLTLADKPQYVMDAAFFLDEPADETHFTRDVDFLPDGSMLLTDSGCESGSCANPGRLFRVTPYYRNAAASALPGSYSLEHDQINLFGIPDENVLEEFQCGYGSLFEAQWIQPAELGRSLRNAAAEPIGACPAAE